MARLMYNLWVGRSITDYNLKLQRQLSVPPNLIEEYIFEQVLQTVERNG